MNPNKIPKSDLPLIVFSDHSSGFIQWLIKWRTKANYNHVMTQLWPGEFVSQGNVFSSVPIFRYATKQSRLKYWRIKDLTEDENILIKKRILERLALPAWKRRYNYIGIFGQATGLRWLTSPWVPYCSQQILWDVIKDVIKTEILVDGKTVILPENPSPRDLNEFFKVHPRMILYGRWAAD